MLSILYSSLASFVCFLALLAVCRSEFFYLLGSYDWKSGKSRCQNEGGWMAFPNTADEFNAVTERLMQSSNDEIWMPIFLNCGTYQWFDGSAATIANYSGNNNTDMEWEDKQPNDTAKEFCVVLKKRDATVRLHDSECSKAVPVMCYNGSAIRPTAMYDPSPTGCLITTTTTTTFSATTSTASTSATQTQSTIGLNTTRFSTYPRSPWTTASSISSSQSNGVSDFKTLPTMQAFKTSANGKVGSLIENLKGSSSNRILASIFPDDMIHTSDPAQKLVRLMSKCDHFAPYRTAPPEQTQVVFNFGIDSVIGIDTVEQVISVNALLALTWIVDTCHNENIKVSKTSPPELIQVLSPDSVWTPRYRFLTSSTSNSYLQTEGRFGETLGEDLIASIREHETTANKSVGFYWAKAGEFSASCHLELEIFPFDKQTCSFSFSLIRANHLFEIGAANSRFLWPEEEEADGEWHYQGGQIVADEFLYGEAAVSGIHFVVTLKRNPSYYMNIQSGNSNVSPYSTLTRNIHSNAKACRSASHVDDDTVGVNFHPIDSSAKCTKDHVQNLTWLCTACLFYQMLTCCLAANLKKADASKPPLAFFGGKLPLIRLIDILAFIVTLAASITMAWYLIRNAN